MSKKFKVERWESFLKTMRIGETAQFLSSNAENLDFRIYIFIFLKILKKHEIDRWSFFFNILIFSKFSFFLTFSSFSKFSFFSTFWFFFQHFFKLQLNFQIPIFKYHFSNFMFFQNFHFFHMKFFFQNFHFFPHEVFFFIFSKFHFFVKVSFVQISNFLFNLFDFNSFMKFFNIFIFSNLCFFSQVSFVFEIFFQHFYFIFQNFDFENQFLFWFFSKIFDQDCVQYMTVSKTLRDIKAGRQVHGCMGGMHHGHSHNEKDEIEEIISNPEDLTFQFTLVVRNLQKKI